MITLSPSVYHSSGKDGDFSWMLTQPQWKDALFIYNDNTSQSAAFLDEVAAGTVDPSSNACQAGAGNGAIRPAQCLTPPRAAGIPTGPGFPSLDATAKATIDRALAYVGTLLATGRYTDVVYSASSHDPNELGHGTFSVPHDVLMYIPKELKALVDAANASG